MVAPMFILTRTFAISAMFVGAFPMAYAAPVPSKAAAVPAVPVVLPRFCRQMGCLFALPEGDGGSSNATENSSGTVAPADSPPAASDVSTSALQVIDFLISALKSAASSIQQSQATANATVDAVAPAAGDSENGADIIAVEASANSADSVENSEGDSSPGLAPAPNPASSVTEVDAPVPAVEVVGFSTIKSTEVDSPASV